MPGPTPVPDADRNLLFGVLALQLDLLDAQQFADGCAGWAVSHSAGLGDWLVARSWLTPSDRAEVERLLERKVKKHGTGAALRAATAAGPVRQALDAVPGPDVRQSLGLPPADGPAVPPTKSLLPEQSRFALTRVHKEGGLGRVWVARDARLNREVAFKEIKPQHAASPEARRRLLQEAQITGQLEHPNIVPVYEYGRWPVSDEPFYAMKFVAGQTLSEAVAAHHTARRAGEAEGPGRRHLLGAFVSVCQAVAYAHARGVLHRDLKPANVVLGRFGEVIVLDWGLAKVLGGPEAEGDLPQVSLSEEARAGVSSGRGLLGTPAYMAPEQADRRLDLVDRRTDVYGLGAVLFEILTGRPPYEGPDTDAVCRRILTEETPRARAAEPSVPAGLDAICARAMARGRAERYAGVSELADAVRRWLDDEPLAAYRDFVAELEKLVREHPAAPDYREQLARNRVNLGLVLAGMGRAAEAEAVFRAAVAEYESLATAHPRAPAYRADLAAARVHLSRALLALGRRAEAEQAQRAAAADYEQLMAADPQAQDYHSNLASVMLTLAPGVLQARPPAAGPPPPGAARTGAASPEDTGAGTVDYRPGGPAREETGREEDTAEVRGRFTLTKRLGAGAMGSVWVARDKDLNREVAIKELAGWPGDEREVRRRFLREAQITAQLEHPNIVPVYGLGYRSQGEAPFLIMRLVRGPTLKQAVAEHHRGAAGAATPHRLLGAFVKVCEALDYAHRRGVIHRDPKPTNVLLGPDGEVMVVDWGLAKLVGREDDGPAVGLSERADVGATLSGAVMGTPAYMAPEQARGEAQQIDARTDVYVLGATLFEILTGKVPHAGQSTPELLVRIAHGESPRARAANPAVPPALDAVCARAMASAQADRYPSAAELGRDVERWLTGEAVSAYAEPWFRRLRRRLRV
jgi:serine/threonine protein kinase